MGTEMQTVLLVILLIVAVALIAVVLLQRSEGGALGIGGGGGGFMSARGAGDLLTRTTAILAALFYLVAIGLTVVERQEVAAPSILDEVGADPLAIPDEEAGNDLPATPEVPAATDGAVEPNTESPQTPSVPVE